MNEQILIAVPFALLILEEIILRRNNPLANQLEIVDSSKDPEYYLKIKRNTRIQKSIRLTELVFIVALVLLVTSTRSMNIFLTKAGQISGLLLLLQIGRIMSRRVVNDRIVLTTATAFQFFLFIPLFFLWDGELAESIKGNSRAMSFFLFAALFFLTLCIPFIITYFAKLFSKDHSKVFYSTPPLIFSEKWVRRILPVTIFIACVRTLLVCIFLIVGDYAIEGLVIPGTTLFLLILVWILFRNKQLLHHPAAMSLIAFAWFINMLTMLLASA